MSTKSLRAWNLVPFVTLYCMLRRTNCPSLNVPHVPIDSTSNVSISGFAAVERINACFASNSGLERALKSSGDVLVVVIVQEASKAAASIFEIKP